MGILQIGDEAAIRRCSYLLVMPRDSARIDRYRMIDKSADRPSPFKADHGEETLPQRR
jgi:hypothetical protein